MSSELLDKFVADIDEFKLAVVEGRANLQTAGKLAEAAKRLIVPVIEHPPETPMESLVPEATDSPASEVVEQLPVMTELDHSIPPVDQTVPVVEERAETPIETLELSSRITELLKRDNNGPAFLTVEALKAFVAAGRSLADEKVGIGQAMELTIVSKLT